MGFSLITEGLLPSQLPDEPWRPVITRVGYRFAFLLVILGRQQLSRRTRGRRFFP
jgi:hypothetical protein